MAYRFKHSDRPLDDYTIQRAVGTGGFGEVYYAVSDGGREVALKYLRQNPQIELRGVSHCINLKSPHLVSIFDVKKNMDDDYFIIMEYCSGPSLRDLMIAEPNGFPSEKAAFFVREIAKGLAYLHDRGIVHRDLKPGNIFYDDGYVKIGDYGLSKFISVSRHSAQTVSVGTVHYMAPEIGSGDYSRGVDIYALGVILYEMLLGKVPFEGSTMAEILMKHLTTQPEVHDLPEPFGKVIRKALEKDPKDRYLHVDEMVDDLLAVETVKESLAGFSPQSLQGAVRRGTGDRAASPDPSPNPVETHDRGHAHGGDYEFRWPDRRARAGSAVRMSPNLDKRLKRISRKLDRKLARLTGKSPLPVSTGRVREGGASPWSLRRMPPALGLSIGLISSLGAFVGNSTEAQVGAAAGLLTVAMAIGVGLSQKMSRWFGAEAGPDWAAWIVKLIVSAPLLFVGVAPMFESPYEDEILGLFLGLLIVTSFADWNKDREIGAQGRLSFGTAFGRGIVAGIVSVIAAGVTDAGQEEVPMFMAFGIAAAATLIVQANMWWLAGARNVGRPDQANRRGRGEATIQTHVVLDDDESGAPSDVDEPSPSVESGDVEENESHLQAWTRRHRIRQQEENHQPVNLERWWITRAFWSVAAFVFMGGAVVGLVALFVAGNVDYHDETATIIACIGSASLMIFALRKTTLLRRGGFWRDTLRPFLLSAMLFGIGATTTGIAREWNHTWHCSYTDITLICMHDEEHVAVLTGLILCSVLFLGLTFFTGRRPRAIRPFVHEPDAREAAADAFGHGERVKPHRGTAVLVMGVLGLIGVFPLGIVAWVMGSKDLAEMQAGRMDPSGREMTKAGKICGIISVVMICVFTMVVFVVSLLGTVAFVPGR